MVMIVMMRTLLDVRALAAVRPQDPQKIPPHLKTGGLLTSTLVEDEDDGEILDMPPVQCYVKEQ